MDGMNPIESSLHGQFQITVMVQRVTSEQLEAALHFDLCPFSGETEEQVGRVVGVLGGLG